MIKGRNQKIMINNLVEQMKKKNLDALILTSAYGVLYSTGFAVRSLYRSGKTGNAVSVVTSDYHEVLIFSQFHTRPVGVCLDPLSLLVLEDNVIHYI